MRSHLFALALPVLYVAVVLGATAVNRSEGRGPTVLSEREATIAPRSDDRTVTEVWLTWSEPAGEPGAWVTPEDLGSLGFDVSIAPDAPGADAHYRRQLTRRAFVAFELDGPAWQAVLADRVRTRGAGEPVPVDRFREEGSRLVPVAVARDADVLARRYPDPRTHLIAAAAVDVRRFVPREGRPYVGGVVTRLDPARVQVPPASSADLPVRPFDDQGRTPYTVSLMYGRRWEPWVAGVTPGDASR